MKIACWPGLGPKLKNLYVSQLYTELLKLPGVDLLPEPKYVDFRSPDVVHFHWPESFLSKKSAVKGYLLGCKLLLNLLVYKASRTRIVWTAHNLKPHDVKLKNTARLFYLIFPKICSHIIFLSDSTRRLALDDWLTDRIPTSVIPHGTYPSINPSSKIEAKLSLNLSEGEKIILAFGMVRPYKRFDFLANLIASSAPRGVRLVIAGEVIEDSELRDLLLSIATRCNQVTLMLTRQSDENLESLIRASDLVVLPYAEIANSGSAIHALSLGTPVLVPDKGSMGELSELVGAEWVHLYSGDLTYGCIDTALSKTPRTLEPTLDGMAWEGIASDTLRAYVQAVNADARS